MAGEIHLSTETRNTLLALQRVDALIERTATRLATGARASVFDNPAAYFESRSLTERVARLLAIKNDVALAVGTLQTANAAIDAIDSILRQMKSLAQQAKSESNANAALLAIQFDLLRDQIDNLVNDATFNAVNLLGATPDSLTVVFNEDGTSKLTVNGIATDIETLGVLSAVDDYDSLKDDADSDLAIAAVDSALTAIRTTALALGASNTLLATREGFLDSLIEQLGEGASKLVDADLNLEAAILLSLQTQRQLALGGLSVLDSAGKAIFDAL